MQVYDMFGALLKDYIYMGDRLIAEYDHVGSRLLYYTPDQINSTRVVTDQAGNVVYSAAHDPYGGIQQTWVSTYDPMPKFSGKERDAESQLDYFGARYYDKNQYRFISVDPALSTSGDTQSSQNWDLYLYCRANPISYFDPDGREIVKVVLTGTQGPLHSYLDSNFLESLRAFLESCAAAGIEIEVTSAFRTRSEQAKQNPQVKNSLHSCGWAIDINTNSLSRLELIVSVSLAYFSGLKWGGFWEGQTEEMHFYSDPGGDRAALIDKAGMTWAAYEFRGISGLSSQDLYGLYGVFTEQAAWLVVGQAEVDLRPIK